MFESLTEKLELALKRFRGQATITEDNIEEAMREIRRALLEADVNLNVARQFVENVKTKAVGTEVKGSLLPEQLIVKLVHAELVEIMGNKRADLVFSPHPPTVILVAGLQGSGKTTFCAKLAKSLRKKGRQPLLVSCDVHRPAAIDQLKQLAQSAGLPVFSYDSNNPIKIATEAINYSKRFARDTVIIDTAGRLTIDEEMMKEVFEISDAVKPTETLFVCDAMIGQDAVTTAKAFHDKLNLTGVILTKLDGDTRGGAALSVLSVVGKPIKYVSTGEKLDALEPFHPERIASRILGMGDILTLVEKAELEVDEKQAQKLEEKLRKNQFTFDDFLEQLKTIKKMGSIRDLLGMLPGMDKALKGVNVDEKNFTRVEAIVLSMTKSERNNPKILNGTRRKRIADGSGTTIQDVNRLLKQFEEMNKMMKGFARGNKMKMLQNMGLPKGFGN
ncbi:MAG: signal recognition particle protein [Ignavibacteria bacterium GWB2_35_12]|nr:MAG: signal recognition particle protein [Ignavibacteria bacterium GWA2_35_8]OGU41866.1 MAG: signal recognition particle protein [Ignavibacteria bacterium GWB2_35_12]OGU86159.1 MAG: signal recognition particle protein [Ignavibacteria bacterium RIFOXYA2_FULL_35_10]OGV23486.1 MAG: signal recognition particle protein [Ignavibacteria bacterium RIFOXYC2_FULL_35_21]